MNKYYRTNRAMWDEMVEINARSDLYKLAEFKKGTNKLDWLVRQEMGEVEGKTLLHLQCHFGMDTLSWALLGAKVTGVDFSSKAIRTAKSLSSEMKIPARFIQTNLYNLPKKLNEQFDLVFTSYGVLCWLHDLDKWSEIIFNYLKPGGFFYIAEIHPFAAVFDDEGEIEILKARYDYFDKDVQKFESATSYADANIPLKHSTEYEWQHTLGEIVSALINAGLTIQFMREYEFCCYSRFKGMTERDDGMWVLPDQFPKVPLIFTLKAQKIERCIS